MHIQMHNKQAGAGLFTWDIKSLIIMSEDSPQQWEL